jgi:hypothetical protein
MVKKALGDKLTILTVSILALLSLVVLSSALRDVTFRPARRLSREESEVASAPVSSIVESIAEISLEKQIAFLVMLFIFSILVVALLPPEMRKRLFRQFLRLLLGGMLLMYLLKIKPDFFSSLFSAPGLEAGEGTPLQSEALPPPVFAPPHVSEWITYLVTFGILLLMVLIIWRVNRWWSHRKSALDAPVPLTGIVGAARASLRSLASDGPAQDKIIQCYADMSQVVDVRRGLFREFAMTPAEFALRLEAAGLPPEPVTRLTRLFESVRYGTRISTQGDVDEAIACLTAILKYCGEVSL